MQSLKSETIFKDVFLSSIISVERLAHPLKALYISFIPLWILILFKEEQPSNKPELSIVTESGMTNCVKLLQPLKADLPSDFILLSKDKVIKELQLLKALSPMLLPAFMSTDTRLVHPLKALLPISLAFFMSTDVRFVHLLKALSPMLLPAFMSTDTRLVHPLKALLPISLAFFMSTDVRFVHPLKALLPILLVFFMSTDERLVQSLKVLSPILPSISMYAFFIFVQL